MEIEKKYFVNEKILSVDLNKYPSKKIEQYYISLNPEIRFRKSVSKNIKYYMTVKSDGTLVRKEVECEIDEKLFESMKECKIGYAIIKTRYNINIINGLIAELDIFEGNLKGLKTVEIEFSNISELNNIDKKLPEWFDRDVTEEKIFKNKALSQVSFNEIKNSVKI